MGHAVHDRLAQERALVTLGRGPGLDRPLDLADPASVEAADLSGLDALVHCAGVTDEDVARDPGEVARIGVVSSQRLALRAREAGVGTIVYVSTAHVYGRLQGTLDEDSRPDPLSVYALAHFSTEQMLKRVAQDGGPRVVVLRASNVFGAPFAWEAFRRWSLIPFGFPRDAVRTGRIELRTSGLQQLNFVANDDIAESVQKALAAIADRGSRGGEEPGRIGPAVPPGESNKTFHVRNVAGAETFSVWDVAQLTSELSAERGRPCIVTRPPGPYPPAIPLDYHSRAPLHEPRCRLRPFLAQAYDWLLAQPHGEEP